MYVYYDQLNPWTNEAIPGPLEDGILKMAISLESPGHPRMMGSYVIDHTGVYIC